MCSKLEVIPTKNNAEVVNLLHPHHNNIHETFLIYISRQFWVISGCVKQYKARYLITRLFP